MNLLKKISRILPMGLLLYGSAFQANADISGITSNRYDFFTSPNAGFPVWRNRTNMLHITGSWIDLTNTATAVGLNGQGSFNMQPGAKSGLGASPAFLDLPINNVNLTGKFRVTLNRPGGSDNFIIDIMDEVSLTSVEVLDINKAPRAGNKFNVNEEFVVRLRGTNLNNLKFNKTTLVTVLDFKMAGSTNTMEDVKVKYTRLRDNETIRPVEFVFGVNGSDRSFCQVNQSTCQTPLVTYHIVSHRLEISPTVTGIFNFKNAPCTPAGFASQLNAFDPARCAGEFAIPNPTPAVPSPSRVVSMPKPKFTVTNTGNGPTPTNLRFLVKQGEFNVLQDIPLGVIAAGASKTFEYNRPENRKNLLRTNTNNCNDCYDVSNVPFGWTDPAYTIHIIDPAAPTVKLAARTFTGTQSLP